MAFILNRAHSTVFQDLQWLLVASTRAGGGGMRCEASLEQRCDCITTQVGSNKNSVEAARMCKSVGLHLRICCVLSCIKVGQGV